MIVIRAAEAADLAGVMRVERDAFGGVGDGAVADDAIFKNRIITCNSKKYDWFLVAVNQGEVAGYLNLQPTHLTPRQCTSWHAATDKGTLRTTLRHNGGHVYVVSFAVKENAPPYVGALLAHAGFVEWLRSGKRYFMFCSRMPGFAAAHKRSGITPERYWRLTALDGGPKDPMLRLYWSMLGGVAPLRLLKNGFPPDADSGGHGVLFASSEPVRALRAIATRICDAGIYAGRESVRKGGEV